MFRGDRLKELRKNKGLKQQELGNMLGITKSAVCFYENSKREPSIEIIIAIMQIFAVSADYLIGTDKLIKVVIDEEVKTYAMSTEEVKFIEELRKNKFVYDVLLADPKRGADLIKKKIG